MEEMTNVVSRYYIKILKTLQKQIAVPLSTSIGSSLFKATTIPLASQLVSVHKFVLNKYF